jgi:ATP-dependent Clp protease ATP-binding subunit ClpA
MGTDGREGAFRRFPEYRHNCDEQRGGVEDRGRPGTTRVHAHERESSQGRIVAGTEKTLQAGIPERVDEVTVFHVLTLENMREIVRMQLDRVVRTAAAPRIIVEVDDSVVDYAVETSYQPQFGARELR